MVIGPKIKKIRESKHLSQGDIVHRTGLLRCYTSRVENGHLIPSIETIGKYAVALEVPLHEFFHDGKTPLKPNLLAVSNDRVSWGTSGKERRELRLFSQALRRKNHRDRKLLFALAVGLAHRKKTYSRGRKYCWPMRYLLPLSGRFGGNRVCILQC